MLIKHMRNQEPKITVKQKWPPDDVGSDHQLIPESDPLLSGMAVLPNVSDPCYPRVFRTASGKLITSATERKGVRQKLLSLTNLGGSTLAD